LVQTGQDMVRSSKGFCLDSLELTTECFRLESAILALLSQAAYQANEPLCSFESKLSDPALTDKESS